MKQIVIMPGGFHPFHAGHAALYQSAVKAFPSAEVYVAATNDTKTRPFPFNIKEKLAKLAGVAPGHFVQVKSPFKAEEITSQYNPAEDVLIFVRSEKDRTEQPKPGGTKKDGTPAYFQPWTGKNLQPFSKHAYIAYLPTVEFGPGIQSATEIRNMWPKLNDKRKTALVMSLYPITQTNPKLAANVVKMLDIGMGEQQGVAEGLNEMDKTQTSPGRDGDIDWTKKQIHLGPEHTMKAKDVAKHALKVLNKTMKKSHADILKKKNVAEAFGPLPRDKQQIRLGRHTVDIERVGMDKDYMSFAWYDSQGQDNYQEVPVGDLGSYDDLIDRIKQEISYQERKYTDQGVAEDKESDPVTNAVLSFYKPVINDIHKEKLPDYVDQARELLQKTDDPKVRSKLIDIFKKGKENPYIQGGIVTTVGAVLAGGILTTAQKMGLSPAQTNLALQAILNTVIPTVVSRINGKSWSDTIKYTLASAGIGTGIAGASLVENDPWGDQGNFAGDRHVDIGGSFTKRKLNVGDLVKVNAGHFKGIGEISKIKDDRAEVWMDSYAKSFMFDLSDLVKYIPESIDYLEEK
jgi:hypothetical protein